MSSFCKKILSVYFIFKDNVGHGASILLVFTRQFCIKNISRFCCDMQSTPR